MRRQLFTSLIPQITEVFPHFIKADASAVSIAFTFNLILLCSLNVLPSGRTFLDI